jgi:hypothetical protein
VKWDCAGVDGRAAAVRATDTRPLSTAADRAILQARAGGGSVAHRMIGVVRLSSREMSPAPEQLLRSASGESKRAGLGC